LIRATILGATGYSGGELVRRLLTHPAAVLRHVTSVSSAGQPLHAVHSELRGRTALAFEAANVARLSKDSDVVFSCLPAGAGIEACAEFVKNGVKVIDLSADFRLPSRMLYRTWYKQNHTAPRLLATAVYGLPELFRSDIISARLVANPGCYATAAILSAAPLLKPLWIDPRSLIVDAKSGMSGAGKKVVSDLLFCEVNENFQAYSPAAHRHQPEIETILGKKAGVRTQVTFVPHYVPMQRGILSVLYATLKKPVKTADLLARYARAYENEPYVRVLPEGELPQTKDVAHTNYCDIGVTQDARAGRVIVIAALDNLVKGAAGQAIQNMNLCFNRPETEGLK
jgi:N-acetyl-gamma-glutamyl-phosphate reductase